MPFFIKTYIRPIFIVVAVLLLICIDKLTAQTDSTLQLREVEVTADRINLTDIGKHTDQIDNHTLSASHQNNLASLLAINTPLFVRTYGAGTLATLGIRGGSASHTQLLWNGIPLRNPMIGLQDLALIPSSFIDETAIHYGGHGAAFGSGSVGGLISISNASVNSDNKTSLNLSAGSWGYRLGELQLNYGFGKFRFSSRLFSQHADNNYRYRIAKGFGERNQVHNELKNQGLLQEVTYSLNNKEWLTGRVWFQYADRQIPPTSTQTTSQSGQQDEILRTSLQWNYKGEKVHWQMKTAWLDEINDYQDSVIILYAHNRFRTWLAEGETTFQIGRDASFNGGVYTEVASGKSDNYLFAISRNQSAAFASIRLIDKKWLWCIQVREELTDNSWSPLLIDLSTEWSFAQRIKLKTSLSRNYRTPTLNDLNWRPGGNPDLAPEQGWTGETGIYYNMVNEKINLSASITGYHRVIDQWIMWLPPVKDLREWWSPINITSVRSHGFEFRGSLGWTTGQWKIDVNTGLDLTWSVFETPLKEFNIEAGDQLFYVPVENFMSGLTIQYHQWSAYYNHHWFGKSTGINDQLPAANIGSAGISLNIGKSKFREAIYLQVDNAWNIPYRIIERRPMPGRSFVGGVKFTIW